MLPLQVLQIELLGGLFMQTEKMADRMSADQVADFLGGVLCVVGSALDGLRHGDDMNAIGSAELQVRLQMAHDDEIVQSIDLLIGSQHLQRASMVTLEECGLRVTEHLAQN